MFADHIPGERFSGPSSANGHHIRMACKTKVGGGRAEAGIQIINRGRARLLKGQAMTAKPQSREGGFKHI